MVIGWCWAPTGFCEAKNQHVGSSQPVGRQGVDEI